MKDNAKTIITAAHDRGGMMSIFPVIKLLEKETGIKLTHLFSGPAAEYATSQNIKYENAAQIEEEQLKKILDQENPALILTGTSSGITIEKKLIRLVNQSQSKIPTVSVLDSWVNYRYQFSLNDEGTFTENELPKIIFVIDEIAKDEMIVQGFPPERLVITGNPFFESFKSLPLAAKKDEIIFADQHLSELMERGVHEDFGYDEREVFRDFIATLEKLNWQGTVLIKFHPGSQSKTRYDVTIAKTKIKIEKVDPQKSLHELLLQAPIIFGMNSMVLFESALEGRVVISYQPHLRSKVDPLMSNRIGLSHATYNPEELEATLKKLLNSQDAPKLNQELINHYTKSQAAQKILTEIKKMLKQ